MRTFISLNLSIVHNLKIFTVSKYFVLAYLKTVLYLHNKSHVSRHKY